MATRRTVRSGMTGRRVGIGVQRGKMGIAIVMDRGETGSMASESEECFVVDKDVAIPLNP